MPLLGLEPQALRRMFNALEADEAYLSQAARAFEGDPLAAPEALKGRLLREMLADAGREPSFARMQELEKHLRCGHQSGLRENLHRRFSSPLVASLCPTTATSNTQKKMDFIPLQKDFIKNLPKTPKEGLANCLDCDTIVGKITAGRRTPGDSMRLVGGAGTKSFKKLCQERGVSPGARERLAVARDERGLVWIEGMGCAHRCRITESTIRAVRVELTVDN